MKHLLLTIACACLYLGTVFSQAPSYVNFEWDILRLGVASKSSTGSGNTGLYLGGELRFNLKDDLSIGFAGDLSFFEKDDAPNESDTVWGRSSSLTIDKYFSTTSSKRFFAGAGFGRYTNGETLTINGDITSTISGDSSFGIAPRVGYELGHLRIMAQYHYTTKKEVFDYLSINIGLTLWGGYKG